MLNNYKIENFLSSNIKNSNICCWHTVYITSQQCWVLQNRNRSWQQ